MQKKIITLISLLSFISVIILFIVSWTSYLPQYNLDESQITTQKIIAPFTFKIYKTEAELKSEKAKIKKNIEPIYKISTNFTFNSIKNLDYIFSQLDKYSKLSSVDDIKSEMEKVGFSFSKQTIKILKDDITRKLLYDYMTKRVNYILSVGIYNDKDNVKSYKVKRKSSVKIYEKKRLFSITEAIDNLTRKISVQNRKSVEEISNYVLNYNIVVDKQLTDKILYNKISDISLFKGQVLKNEEIIGKNKKVTSQTIAVLNSLKKAYPEMQNGAKSNWNSSFIFQFFLLIILYYSIFFTINNVMQKNLEFKVYLLIYILVFLQFTLLLIQNNISHISILYFPYEFFILLIAISIMPEIAIFLNLILILMISQLIPGSFYAISVHGIISLVAVLWNKKVLRERHSYYLIGFILFFSSAIIVLLSVISHNFTVKTFFNNLLFIFVSNIVTIILLILVTPTVEKTLSITTDERLFRLIDYTNKLLKRLSKQASGTYYHSLNVGGIAENAAEAIGANAILARVAGYYHDIGKLENSEIFSENTLNNTTKHDILLPQESASLIKKHIKHGVILAKKFNLPTEVIDVIKQHHGTTEIKYFLNKARQANLDIDEEHFRYPGPIPQNKESALIMISDIVESTTKSKKKLDNNIIVEVIEDTINSLISRKQLIDSGLTLKDIELIKPSLIFSIEGIYGSRVEYPNEAKS